MLIEIYWFPVNDSRIFHVCFGNINKKQNMMNHQQQEEVKGITKIFAITLAKNNSEIRTCEYREVNKIPCFVCEVKPH